MSPQDRLTLLQEADLHTENGARTHKRYGGSRLDYLKRVYREGCALLQAARHHEAADAFSAALAEAPDFDDAAQNLGCCLAALGRYEDAASTYARVVQLRPGDAGAHFNLGSARLAAGTHEGAITALREAVRLGPSLAKHHAALGQALIAADRKAEALLPLREAARLDATNPMVLALLAGLLVDEGPPPRTNRPATALDGLALPDGAPRVIVALVGQNENGILRSVSEDFMAVLPAYGLSGHVIDMADDGWSAQLSDLVTRGVLFAWGAAGIGARLQHRDGNFWDAVKVPFLSVMADSPCWMPANHHVPSRYVANGYLFRDWLDMQRRLIRSPQISALLQHGVLPNPAADAIPWGKRPRRMVLVKTGCDPTLHQLRWQRLPRRFRAVLEESAAAALREGVRDISDTVLRCLSAHDLFLETRPDILFGLMQEVDVFVRDDRSTAMVRAMLDLPVDIIGRGWEHLAAAECKARFHPAIDASGLACLYAETQFLLNTMPNFANGTHERVLNGFAARCCVVTNENADMRARFGDLPSYFPVDTAATGLADELAALFHTAERFDDALEPAHALVRSRYAPECFMRSMIDLALEVAASDQFASFRYG